MANLAVYEGPKYIQSEGIEVVRSVWDFSVDGGAVASYNIFQAKHDMVVVKACLLTKTLCATSASGTLSLGFTGSVAGLVAATAAASLTANSVTSGVSATGVGGLRIAADGYCLFDIATGALTAGKVEALMFIAKF